LLVWLLVLSAFATRSCGSGAKPRHRTGARMIVPLLVTGFAALDAVRHIPIFVLVAIPIIGAALPVASTSWLVRRGRPDSSPLRPLFNGAVIVLMAVFALTRWVSLACTQDAREAEQFPERAVEFLRAGCYAPKLFAYYDWGGYAVWKLYPEYRVFVDGRADLYGDDLLRQFQTVVNLRTGWRAVLDGWGLETALLPPSAAITQALLLDPEWRVVFSDSKAVILLRGHPAVHRPILPTDSS
jgi:hypothetical protein